MSPISVQCPKCQAVLSGAGFNQPGFQVCPNCSAGLEVEVFPALFRLIPAGQAGEMATVDGEATCFYHPQKRAVLACEGCGRFVCGLCDCELQGQHFCPTCLDVGKKKGKIKNLENHRVLYDSIAISLAVLPMLIFYFTIFTAPMTLYLVIRRWNAPTSVTRGRRHTLKLSIAFIIAMLQIVGWACLLYYLASRTPTPHATHG
jgi:hypothetical protein